MGRMAARADSRLRLRLLAATAVAILVLGLVALRLVPRQSEFTGSGNYRSRVTARFLDAETRAPLQGVSVIVLRELSGAEDAVWIEGRLRAREEWPDAPTGVATSGDDGAVVVQASAPFCHFGRRDGAGRVVEESGAPHPGYGAAGVLAEKPGYRRRVVETPRERWTAVESRSHDDPAAAFDLGDVLLQRE